MKDPKQEEAITHTFNPNDHLMQISSKDYLPVQWRLVWFREAYPHGTIDTEEVEVDLDREVEEEAYVWNKETRRSEKVIKHGKGYARFKAVVTDGQGGRATGTKSENAASFPDYVEKAETGAIGRALAGLGFGTQFTGDEFDEKHRIVDAPVDPATTSATNTTTTTPNSPKTAANVVPPPELAPVPEPILQAAATLDTEALLNRFYQYDISEQKQVLIYMGLGDMDPAKLRELYDFTTGYHNFRDLLNKWDGSRNRMEWLASPITRDQQIYILGKSSGILSKIGEVDLKGLRDLDIEMAGKPFKSLTVAQAYRLIGYFKMGYDKDTGNFLKLGPSDIPEQFRNKAAA